MSVGGVQPVSHWLPPPPERSATARRSRASSLWTPDKAPPWPEPPPGLPLVFLPPAQPLQPADREAERGKVRVIGAERDKRTMELHRADARTGDHRARAFTSLATKARTSASFFTI